MLATYRDGLAIAGTNLQEDPAAADAAAAPADSGTAWWDPTQLVSAASDAASAAVANVTNAAQCASACAPFVAESRWSIKKPMGAAIALGGGVLALIIGLSIGKHHTSIASVSGRHRRRY